MNKPAMKIAIVTDDLQTISPHFGRARYYLVFTVENDRLAHQETRPKANGWKSTRNLETIIDCDVLLAGRLSRRAYAALQLRSLEPILTDILEVQEAVAAYLAGTLINQLERLH